MALNADTLLDRVHLKNQAQRWRFIALAVGLVASLLLFGKINGMSGTIGADHIARFSVEDVIVDDIKRHELLSEIAENDNVKALILRMDSPGGTTVGSDQLYNDLRDIAAKKPVICTMRSMATSGGYLAAIAADYIVANPGTLTGSVGVILQTAEFTGLAEKLGITPITVKSGELKASPTMFETFGEKERDLITSIINDFQRHFLALVQKRRELSDEQVKIISDGRVVSAQQALDLKLINAIGGEREALAWLQSEHNIDTELKILDVKVEDEEEPLERFLKNYTSSLFTDNPFTHKQGLLSLWRPSIAN